MFSDYKTRTALLFSCNHWLVEADRGSREKVHFLATGPNDLSHTPLLEPVLKRTDGSNGSLYPFKFKVHSFEVVCS